MSFLLEVSLRAAALWLLGAAAGLALRRAGAHLRHTAWLMVALSMLALPILRAWLPPAPVTVPGWRATAAVEVVTLPLLTDSAAGGAAPPPATRRVDWWLAGYAAGVLVLLLRLVIGAFRLRGIVRNSGVVEIPAAAELAARLGVDPSNVQVRASAEVRVPFTTGVRWPLIFLPASWPEWTQIKLRSVLAHELAHVARRDWLAARLASINRLVFWFHPLAWWVERRLAALAEEAADREALAVVGDRRSYAGAILDFALVMQDRRMYSMEATAMARSTKVGRRVESILAASSFPHAALSRGAAFAGVLIAIPLLYGAAALAPEPQAPPPQPQANLSVESRRGAAGLMPPAEAAELEKRLQANQLDSATRLKLLSHYLQYQDKELEAIIRHARFLVENQPQESAAATATQLLFGQLRTPSADAEKRELLEMWKRHAAGKSDQAAVLGNAAQVFQNSGMFFEAEDCLQRARRLEPGNARRLSDLAFLYLRFMPATGGSTDSSFRSKVRAELDTSSDAGLLLTVGELLMPGGKLPVMRTAEQQQRAKEEWKKRFDLAERYLQQARTLGADAGRVDAALGRLAAAREARPVVNFEAPKRITVGANVQERMLLEKVEPEYPPLARQARIQGTVRFNIVIGRDGVVQTIQVESGHPLLVQAATEAVRRWRYKPTHLNGEPVEVMTLVAVHFALSGEATLRPAEGVYRVGGGVSAPVLEYKTEPQYTDEASAARLEGTVLIRLVVGVDGLARDARVIRPLGMGLDENALESLRGWRFAPGIKDGQPVPVEATVEINFRLK